MKRKIGIVTMYHNSINYGGVLQAYALAKFLNDQGYDAEQIRFVPELTELQKIKRLFHRGVKRAIKDVLKNARWFVRKICGKEKK